MRKNDDRHVHFIGARVTPAQFRKLNGLASILGCSKSAVLTDLIESAEIEKVSVRRPVGVVRTNGNVGDADERVAV